MTTPLVKTGKRCDLYSPTAMPRASAFLWNRTMMMQVNCRGFVTAQHMQPEPARYSHGPNLEAQSFMQPEQPYYAHHPGRFFYIRDEENGEVFSVPYEPVRRETDSFRFSAGTGDITWQIRTLGLQVVMQVSLPRDDAVELWSLDILNSSGRTRKWSIYPYFTLGYMSWMNQSARYRPELGGIVASSVTPYQKLEDYDRIRSLKDKTFLLHDTKPDAWETNLEAFEGEGGLSHPDALRNKLLAGGEAVYETPAAVLQYRVELAAGKSRRFRFIFGPARDEGEIKTLRKSYLSASGFEKARCDYGAYLEEGAGSVKLHTPDAEFDHFANHWLPRQVYYHGSTNRLSTDPQTRNYLQDAMGMVHIQPRITKKAILTALSQQEADGALPDGIRLSESAELKFINQVPHTDHCVWLPVCLQAYLDETGDYALLDQTVESHGGQSATVSERVSAAMQHLVQNLDGRKLSLISQGDWCDPMNMVGHKGKGVSGWLSIATVYVLHIWADICEEAAHDEQAARMRNFAVEIENAIQEKLWDGKWFARGISDDGRVFGIDANAEGRIFLNPQSWALMAGMASDKQTQSIVRAVKEHLETPYGVMMLAPAFTRMHEDIGRVTQKFPGSAENGSIYNHAAAFYVFALFKAGRPGHAWELLRHMIPGPDEKDLLQRGQLPVFIPNYYRGAVDQYPRTAGRSSQLFNTGTASWIYRILVEQLFGLKGCREGLRIKPQLPPGWNEAAIERKFRGAIFKVSYSLGPSSISVDGSVLEGSVIGEIEAGKTYRIEVVLEEDAV